MRIGVLTGGGDCPGLNAVIRGIVRKGINQHGHAFVGFRYGWAGVLEGEAMDLTLDSTRGILHRGGTILGTSRGDQDPALMVETLVRLGISVLFVLGGDGSLRGAAKIASMAERLGVELSVIGVPKTIDNDIPYLDQSFGFQTAFTRATDSIKSAPSADGLRTVLNFQRVGSQRYFDVAGFPGRTVGLDEEKTDSKKKTAGK